MTVNVNRRALIGALDSVKPARGSAKALPVITHDLIDLDDGSLRVTATDLDLWLRHRIDVDGDDTGAGIVSPTLLRRVLRAARGDDVAIDLDDTGLHVRGERLEGTLRLRDEATDFPKWPTLAGDPITVDEHTIDAIQQVSFAASGDWARPVITGVYVADGFAVATDSYRLAWREVQDDLGPLLIPAAHVQHLPVDGPVQMTVTDKNAAWSVGDVDVVSRLIEGQFPNYRQLIDGAAAHPAATVTFDREEMVERLGHIVGLLNSDPYPVRIDVEADRLTLSVSVQDGFTYKDTIACSASEPITVAYNPRYLREALDAGSDDTATMFHVDGLKPGLFAEDDYSCLIMPVRIDGTTKAGRRAA